jgi:glycosyltransferase involved in cell wall biosynthesis
LVGDGPLRESVRRKARNLGLDDRVRFAGLQDDVVPFLSAMDLLLVTSDFEGLPLVVLEAMATELPVVATAVGGIPEAVTEGETGHLVPPGDPHEAAEVVLRILASRETARALGRAGRRRVESEYGTGRMMSDLEDLYREILERRRGLV